MKTLDPGKLTSVDAHGDRITIIPAEVKGFFRKHRTWTQLVLLAIFLAIPWTEINGHQTILLDIPNRDFALFGMSFKAHDVPLLFFVLAILTLGLAFITSIWGRVWCGWACPQTVFIDAVYRRIEQWTEGNYIERRRLKNGPMNAEKVRKSGLKWVLFVITSSLIAHSFVAYFVGSKSLIKMMQGPPSENLTYFIIVSFFTAITLFDFAWFREQFCVIMCPYGRIQSLLLDQKSLAVVYDVKRGEPRRGAVPAGQQQGDCVSCNRCVQVCPTGIDIRNGLQMECIACTACIDACDEIMTKTNKPKGLIKYDTLDGSKINYKRPRSVIYFTAIMLLFGGFVYALSTHEPVHFTILRSAGLPYSINQDAEGNEIILNQFKMHIQNQGSQHASYQLSLPQELIDKGYNLTAGENPLPLPVGQSREWFFFIRTPRSEFQTDKISIRVSVKDLYGKTKSYERTIQLVGPRQ